LTAGITDRALRQELQDLEACNLVRKERCAWDGRRVEYRLSPFGETLKPLLAEVYLWGLRVQESRPAAAAWGGGSS
jgi:DNA-binding HxlR family transcriptional regulator